MKMSVMNRGVFVCCAVAIGFLPDGAANIFAQEVPAVGANLQEAKGAAGDTDSKSDWAQLLKNLAASDQNSAAAALAKADYARDFYATHQVHPCRNEARKIEALCLLDAALADDNSSGVRMQEAVRAFLADKTVASADRAVVAGTYEFQMARARIHSQADMFREYESVARNLMREFPDQPQGYISLLTQSMQRDPAVALAMAEEIAKSSGPEMARKQARRLMNRLGLLGKPIAAQTSGVFDQTVLDRWQKGKPGLIYFWATWNPDSIKLAEALATRAQGAANVIGVCLDSDLNVARAAAAEHRLPGVLIFDPRGVDGAVAEKLGAFESPVVYYIDGRGITRDVRVTDDIDAKLSDLGL